MSRCLSRSVDRRAEEAILGCQVDAPTYNFVSLWCLIALMPESRGGFGAGRCPNPVIEYLDTKKHGLEPCFVVSKIWMRLC